MAFSPLLISEIKMLKKALGAFSMLLCLKPDQSLSNTSVECCSTELRQIWTESSGTWTLTRSARLTPSPCSRTRRRTRTFPYRPGQSLSALWLSSLTTSRPAGGDTSARDPSAKMERKRADRTLFRTTGKE